MACARSDVLFAQVSILAANPVFAARGKEIDVYGIFERDGGMRLIRGDVKHFAAAHDHLSVVKDEFQRSRQDQRKLLAHMKMARHHRTARHQQPRHGGVIATEHLTRDQLIKLLTFELFPRSLFHLFLPLRLPPPLPLSSMRGSARWKANGA